MFLPGPASLSCLALPGCSLARFAILLVHICIRIFPPERNSATQWITAHFSLSFRSVGSSYFHSMSVPTSAAEIRDRPRIDRRRGTREGEASPRPLQDNYYRVAEMVTWGYFWYHKCLLSVTPCPKTLDCHFEWTEDSVQSLTRGLPFMTSANYLDVWTPSPLSQI